ncbi:hypothetical protein EOM82_05555 [bacterium]|nr:hypothetical protein [bacterium]
MEEVKFRYMSNNFKKYELLLFMLMIVAIIGLLYCMQVLPLNKFYFGILIGMQIISFFISLPIFIKKYNINEYGICECGFGAFPQFVAWGKIFYYFIADYKNKNKELMITNEPISNDFLDGEGRITNANIKGLVLEAKGNKPYLIIPSKYLEQIENKIKQLTGVIERHG